MGLAGEPEDRGAYVAFAAAGVTIYLARGLEEQVEREGGRLRVLMPGYGEAEFRFEPGAFGSHESED